MKRVHLGAAHDKRKRIRRSALLFGLIALVFYAGFIVLSVVRNSP